MALLLLLPAPFFLFTFLFLTALFFDPAARFLFCVGVRRRLFGLLFPDPQAGGLVRCRIPIVLLSNVFPHDFFPFSFVVDSSAGGAGRESMMAVALHRVPCFLIKLPHEFTVNFSLQASCSLSGN